MGSVPDSNNDRGSIPVLWMLWITTFGRPKTIKNPQKKTGRFTRPNHIMGLQPLIPKSGDRRFPWQEPTKTPLPSAYNLVVQAWRRQWPRQPIAKSSICLVHFVVELLGPQVFTPKQFSNPRSTICSRESVFISIFILLNPLLNAHLASCEAPPTCRTKKQQRLKRRRRISGHYLGRLLLWSCYLCRDVARLDNGERIELVSHPI